MKIYAVRDRLIDYYMQPFIAPTDKQVMGAISTTINNPEQTSAIQAAPHQFEIWTLGEIDEESGKVTARLELVADCASLVRRDLRDRAPHEPGVKTNGTVAGSREGAPG